MTLHRFFIPTQYIAEGIITLPIELKKQLTKVLRLKTGDKIILLDGTGFEYLVELNHQDENIQGKIISKKDNNSEPKVKITLYQSLTTKDKFETVLQKGTEVGVTKFIPIQTDRSLLKIIDIKPDRMERFKKVIQEAAEQSERGIVPELGAVLNFEQAIENASISGSILIAWEKEDQVVLSDVLSEFLSKTANIGIFIGPEGGFDQQEIEFAVSKGAQLVSLGPRVLRTETAGLVFASLILFAGKELDKNRS